MADTLCGNCGRYFKGYRGLRIHQGKTACGNPSSRRSAPLLSASEKDTLCVQCGRYFKGQRGLKIHQGKTACGYSLTSTPQHSINTAISLSPEKDTPCETCGRYFKGQRGLKIHQGKTACGNPSSYMRHITVSAPLSSASEKDTLCVECGRYFKGQRGLKIHQGKTACGNSLPSAPPTSVNTISLSSENDTPCETCGRYFKGQKGLKIHKGKTACGNPLLCMRQITVSAPLSSASEKDTLCEKCGRYFKGQRGLKIHQGKTACGNSFLSLPQYTVPISFSSERDTLCVKCGRYFEGYMDLQNHLAMTACGTSFPLSQEGKPFPVVPLALKDTSNVALDNDISAYREIPERENRTAHFPSSRRYDSSPMSSSTSSHAKSHHHINGDQGLDILETNTAVAPYTDDHRTPKPTSTLMLDTSRSGSTPDNKGFRAGIPVRRELFPLPAEDISPELSSISGNGDVCVGRNLDIEKDRRFQIRNNEMSPKSVPSPLKEGSGTPCIERNRGSKDIDRGIQQSQLEDDTQRLKPLLSLRPKLFLSSSEDDLELASAPLSASTFVDEEDRVLELPRIKTRSHETIQHSSGEGSHTSRVASDRDIKNDRGNQLRKDKAVCRKPLPHDKNDDLSPRITSCPSLPEEDTPATSSIDMLGAKYGRLLEEYKERWAYDESETTCGKPSRHREDATDMTARLPTDDSLSMSSSSTKDRPSSPVKSEGYKTVQGLSEDETTCGNSKDDSLPVSSKTPNDPSRLRFGSDFKGIRARKWKTEHTYTSTKDDSFLNVLESAETPSIKSSRYQEIREQRGPQVHRDNTTLFSQMGHRYDFMFDQLGCILICCFVFLFLLLKKYVQSGYAVEDSD